MRRSGWALRYRRASITRTAKTGYKKSVSRAAETYLRRARVHTGMLPASSEGTIPGRLVPDEEVKA